MTHVKSEQPVKVVIHVVALEQPPPPLLELMHHPRSNESRSSFLWQSWIADDILLGSGGVRTRFSSTHTAERTTFLAAFRGMGQVAQKMGDTPVSIVIKTHVVSCAMAFHGEPDETTPECGDILKHLKRLATRFVKVRWQIVPVQKNASLIMEAQRLLEQGAAYQPYNRTGG